ncbi:GNAT family N-acetyltransferase [Streptomyces californicus]|uniref:GNAT family N-acetyltransferase n=1 Tax=Streptomyces californicus TaxID=67351 RepID=UPI0037AAC468
MEIREEFGLRIALLNAEEALGGADRLAAPPGVTLLRVPDPPAGAWPQLAARGFVRKPAWISWLSDVAGSEAEWLTRLPSAHAIAIRRARKQVGADVRIGWEHPVSEQLLDEFLELYEDMISRMSHGVPFAVSQREDILENKNNFLVYARSVEGLEGACVCRADRDDDTVVMRFPAYSPHGRRHSLSRVLYMEVMNLARAWGYARMSLGKDPNLYGHISKTGLFEFKARRLGFTPYATEPPFGLVPWRDEADLIVSWDGLSNPALLLGYADEVSSAPDGFVLEVFGDAAGLDGMESLPFVRRVRHHQLDFGR